MRIIWKLIIDYFYIVRIFIIGTRYIVYLIVNVFSLSLSFCRSVIALHLSFNIEIWKVYPRDSFNCVWNKKSSTRLGGPSFDFLFSVEIWFFYRKIFLLHREYILARFSRFVVSLSSIFLYLYTSLYLTRVDLNWLLIEVTCHFFFSF